MSEKGAPLSKQGAAHDDDEILASLPNEGDVPTKLLLASSYGAAIATQALSCGAASKGPEILWPLVAIGVGLAVWKLGNLAFARGFPTTWILRERSLERRRGTRSRRLPLRSIRSIDVHERALELVLDSGESWEIWTHPQRAPEGPTAVERFVACWSTMLRDQLADALAAEGAALRLRVPRVAEALSDVTVVLEQDAERLVEAARRYAGERGVRVKPLHVLRVLLEDARGLEACEFAGADVAAMRAKVDSRWPRIRRVSTYRAEAPRAELSFELELLLLLARCAAQDDALAQVGVARLAMTLVESDGGDSAALFGAHGATPAALRSALAGPSPALEDAMLPADVPAALIFHDDDFTTREFVVAVLVEEVGLPVDEAESRMLAVHQTGRGEVVRRPSAEAYALAHRIAARAQADGMPLRLTVEPVTGP